MGKTKVSDLAVLLPSDIELAEISRKLNTVVTSKTELLSVISRLKLQELTVEQRMIYVLGLVSLGFDEIRARERLNITNSDYYLWKAIEGHEEMLKQAVARGELILEEKVLVAADSDPDMAFKLLERKEKKRERKEELQEQKTKSILDIMKEQAKERGLVFDGEIVDDVLK